MVFKNGCMAGNRCSYLSMHTLISSLLSTGVWKLFLGLVPGNHPTAGDFPVFEAHAGKNLAEEKQRVILVADDRLNT